MEEVDIYRDDRNCPLKSTFDIDVDCGIRDDPRQESCAILGDAPPSRQQAHGFSTTPVLVTMETLVIRQYNSILCDGVLLKSKVSLRRCHQFSCLKISPNTSFP